MTNHFFALVSFYSRSSSHSTEPEIPLVSSLFFNYNQVNVILHDTMTLISTSTYGSSRLNLPKPCNLMQPCRGTDNFCAIMNYRRSYFRFRTASVLFSLFEVLFIRLSIVPRTPPSRPLEKKCDDYPKTSSFQQISVCVAGRCSYRSTTT